MRYIFVIGFGLFCSCSSKNDKSFKSFHKDGLIIKGNVINDSIFNDTMYYYNENNLLISKRFFREGKQSGISIDYYGNGRPEIISNYSDGMKNGSYSVFDSNGVLTYKGFYYYDLGVGPIVYFDQGRPKRYFFIDLNDQDILHIYYPEWDGINNVYDKLINFSTNTIRIDSTKEISVFMYLLTPPKFSFDYSVVKTKIRGIDEMDVIKKLSDSLPFTAFSLPLLHNKEEKYAIKLSVYDSILNKNTIIYKDL
jgi:antitoxin component YwqK of YwqJK toxin-antitoxin module